MQQYASEEKLYEELGAALTAAVADPVLGSQFQDADAVVQHRLSDPDATITVEARASRPPRIELGETKLEPDVVLRMSGDTALQLWHGELNVTLALAAGDIAAKGHVGKLLRHIAVAEPLSKRYDELLASAATVAPNREPEAEAPADPDEAAAEIASDSAAEQAEEVTGS